MPCIAVNNSSRHGWRIIRIKAGKLENGFPFPSRLRQNRIPIHWFSPDACSLSHNLSGKWRHIRILYSTTGMQKTRDRDFHCLPPLAKTDGLFTHFHSLQFHLFFCRINRTTPHIFSFHTPFKAVWNSGIPIAYSFAQTEKSLLRVKIQTLPTIPEILLCPQQTSDFSSITQIWVCTSSVS